MGREVNEPEGCPADSPHLHSIPNWSQSPGHFDDSMTSNGVSSHWPVVELHVLYRMVERFAFIDVRRLRALQEEFQCDQVSCQS
jgi:hypothetical protein